MARVEPVAEPVPSESLSQPLVVPPPPVTPAATPADERQSSAFRADEASRQTRNEQAFAKAETPATTLAQPAPAAAAPPPPPPPLPAAVGAARSAEGQAAASTGMSQVMIDGVSAVDSGAVRPGERNFAGLAVLRPAVPTAIVAEFAVATTAEEARAVRAEPPAPGAQGAGRGRAASPAFAPAPAPAPPAPAIARWRISASGVVERQVAGASAWEQVAITPPAPVLNGAAPSASVCWLVGRGGLVLRTTNGTVFSRVPFPETVDLMSVTATSAQAARVTAANGRTFETTDGGVSWR